jgi:hypothetical protein
MSADNGVYILPSPIFRDGQPTRELEYRVAHAMAIENIEYPPLEKESEWDIFNKSTIFKSKPAALLEADIIYQKLPICEYGIQTLNTRDHEFPQFTKEEVKKRMDEYWDKFKLKD